MITYLASIINHKGNQRFIIYGNGHQFGFQVRFSFGNFTVIDTKNTSSLVKYSNPGND